LNSQITQHCTSGGEQSGARLRLHLLSHCPYPTKSVWIWPPFHNSIQKKVPVKQPPQTHPSETPVGGSPLVVVHPSQELFLTIALKLLLLALFRALCTAYSYSWHARFHTPCTWLQHLVPQLCEKGPNQVVHMPECPLFLMLKSFIPVDSTITISHSVEFVGPWLLTTSRDCTTPWWIGL
jgi:hypothetical protein